MAMLVRGCCVLPIPYERCNGCRECRGCKDGAMVPKASILCDSGIIFVLERWDWREVTVGETISTYLLCSGGSDVGPSSLIIHFNITSRFISSSAINSSIIQLRAYERWSLCLPFICFNNMVLLCCGVVQGVSYLPFNTTASLPFALCRPQKMNPERTCGLLAPGPAASRQGSSCVAPYLFIIRHERLTFSPDSKTRGRGDK